MKKTVTAILLTMGLILYGFLMPVFIQWYYQQTGLEFIPGLTSIVIGLGYFALTIAYWASVVTGKNIKDL